MSITATLIIQILAFAAFIILVNKMLWKPLSGIMADRSKRIEDGLAAAERGQSEMKEAEKEIEALLNQAKIQAGEIVENANSQGNSIIEKAKTQAAEEAQKIKSNAEAEVSQEVNKAKADLQSQVSSLVLLGVSKVLNKEVNQAAHQDMLNDLSQSLSK